MRGRHDQRDHNRWPAGYQAQTYRPTGRRGSAMAARATGGLAGVTQENVLANIMFSPDMIAQRYGVSSQFSSKSQTILSPLDENSHTSDTGRYIGALFRFDAPEFLTLNSVMKSVFEEYRKNGGPTPRKSGGLTIRGLLPSARISSGIELARSQIVAPSGVGRDAEAPKYKKISDYSPDKSTSYEIESLFSKNPDAEIMFDEFDKQFGISTWKLSDDADGSEYTQIAEQAFQNLENTKRQLIALIAETEAATAEYSATYAIHSAIESSMSGLMMQLPRYEQMLNNPNTSDIVKQSAQMVIDNLQQSIDTLSMYEEALAMTLQSLEPFAIEYAKKINNLVAYAELQRLDFGQQNVSQSTIDFLRQHVGASVNPDIKSGSNWMPNVEYTESASSLEKLDERISKNITVLSDVNELLNLLVDGRLRETYNDTHGPNKIVYDSYNKETGSYEWNFDRIRVAEDFASVTTIMHEYMHYINNTVEGKNGVIREQLNALILGFFKKRYDKSKEAYRDGFQWVPDDFPDWYAGILGEVPDPYPLSPFSGNYSMGRMQLFPQEILSMGMTFMLHNPVKFAKEQPDYFRFMSVILSGAWIK